MHHGHNFLVFPPSSNNLDAQRHAFHALRIVPVRLTSIDLPFQDRGTESGSVDPFVCKLIFGGVYLGDGDATGGAIDYVVQYRSSCQWSQIVAAPEP